MMNVRAFFRRAGTACRWAWDDVFGSPVPEVWREPTSDSESNNAEMRDWQFSLGGSGKKGETKTFSHRSEIDFTIEKLIVLEESKRPGLGTKITSAFVGNKHQLPINGRVISYAFLPRVLGNGLKFDTLHPGMDFSIQVQFLEDCTWSCTFFGKASKASLDSFLTKQVLSDAAETAITEAFSV